MLVYQRVVLAHYIQKARTAKLVGSILYWTSACMVSTVNVPSTNPLNVSLHSIMSPWNSVNLEWWLHIIINLNNLPVRYRSHLPKNKKYYTLPGVGLLLVLIVMYQLVSSHITNWVSVHETPHAYRVLAHSATSPFATADPWAGQGPKWPPCHVDFIDGVIMLVNQCHLQTIPQENHHFYRWYKLTIPKGLGYIDLTNEFMRVYVDCNHN